MRSLLGLTGASGYIGKAVARLATSSGWRVVAIGRHPVEEAEEWRLANLQCPPSEGLLDGLDAVIHLASNTEGGGGASSKSEIAFARELARQTAQAAIPLVFASSQASAASAPSEYGRTKYAIEEQIRPLGAVVVRPGMVIGGQEAGLFGSLVGLVRGLPVIPDLLPRPVVQPIHVDDLAAVLLALCKRKECAGRVLTAAGDPIAFVDLLTGIARYRLRVRRVQLPIPLRLVRVLLVLASPQGGSRWSSARLDSLVRLPVFDSKRDLKSLGITLRTVENALDRRGRGVRDLLIEGYALARAVTGAKPPFAMLRRYAYLLQAFGYGDALPLPMFLLRRPTWLAALDMPSLRRDKVVGGSLIWRMNAVSRLAEAQPKLASLYLMTSSRCGKFAAVVDLANAGVREIHSRLLRSVARHVAKAFL